MTGVGGKAEPPVLIEWRGAGEFGEMRFTNAFRACGPELQARTLMMMAGYSAAMMMSWVRVEAGAGEGVQEEVWRVVAEMIRPTAMVVLEKELLAAEVEGE